MHLGQMYFSGFAKVSIFDAMLLVIFKCRHLTFLSNFDIANYVYNNNFYTKKHNTKFVLGKTEKFM